MQLLPQTISYYRLIIQKAGSQNSKLPTPPSIIQTPLPIPHSPFLLYCTNMPGAELLKKNRFLIIVLLFFIILAGAFYLRSPVIVITDNSFIQLYGRIRLSFSTARSSLELFRRVIPVTVYESAGNDLVALAVESASRSPMAVVFPDRYLEGAQLYKEKNPGVPVIVMTGTEYVPIDDTALVYTGTDITTDLYRAGLSAAILAGDKKTLFFYERNLENEQREAFLEGLAIQGSGEEPVFLPIALDYTSYADIGCVVIFGPAVKFLENTPKIPVILFSWLNPAMTPRAVKLVFDDSPWALLTDTLRAPLLPGELAKIPSVPVILRNRIDEKKDFRKLGELIKEKFQKM